MKLPLYFRVLENEKTKFTAAQLREWAQHNLKTPTDITPEMIKELEIRKNES